MKLTPIEHDPYAPQMQPVDYDPWQRQEQRAQAQAQTQTSTSSPPGNIDLTQRPTVKNTDGSISTVRSMSFNEDGQEVLIPTVHPDGYIMSDDEAIAYYHQTGQHLGKFATPQEATDYAERLHQEQEQRYIGNDPWQELEPAAAPQKRPDLLQDQTMPMLQMMAGEVFPWSQRQYTPPDMDPNATPGKVGPGEMNVWPEAMIDIASNIPSLGAKAGLGAAMKGIFAGVGAKTANKMDLKLAEEMLAKGFDKKQIWDATGWFQGKDGKWRFEISDKNFLANYGKGKGVGGPTVAHPGLKEAYDFNELTHNTLPSTIEMGEYYRPNSIDPGGHINVAGTQIEQTMLHELMHAVQQKEGFAKGGSFTTIHELAKEIFPTKTTKERDAAKQAAREVYYRLAGEVEARNVEKRLSMSPEERKRIPPWETEDRPREVQNVRMRLQDAEQSLKEFRGRSNEQQLIEQRIRQIEYDRRLSKVEGEPYPPHAELYALRQRLKELKERDAAKQAVPNAANSNTSQEEIKAMLQPPLSLKDRNWQNYGVRMHPDEVVQSESVWGNAPRLAAEKGISEYEAFAELANDLWQRMGANRYISPEMAKSYMRMERGKMLGIKPVE